MWTDILPPKVAPHATRMAEHISMQTHQNAMLKLADPPERPTHFSYKGLPYPFFASFPGPESHGFIFKIRDLHGRSKFGSESGLNSPSLSLQPFRSEGLADPPRAGTETFDPDEDKFERQFVPQVWMGRGSESNFRERIYYVYLWNAL